MTAPHLTSALDEETARAELYGLIAELFYAPARPDMLAQLRVAPTEAPTAGGFLEEPWRQLVGVTRDMDDLSIQREHDAGAPRTQPVEGCANTMPCLAVWASPRSTCTRRTF